MADVGADLEWIVLDIVTCDFISDIDEQILDRETIDHLKLSFGKQARETRHEAGTNYLYRLSLTGFSCSSRTRNDQHDEYA